MCSPGELRDRVGPASLADRADRRDVGLLDVERVLPEHLARRELDDPLDRRPSSRVPPRARCTCRSRSPASSAPGSRAPCRRPRSRRRARRGCSRRRARSGARDRGRRPARRRKFGCACQLRPRERVAVEVVDRDHLVLVDESSREGRADEPGPAGDRDALALAAARRDGSRAPLRSRRACGNASSSIAPCPESFSSARGATSAPRSSTCAVSAIVSSRSTTIRRPRAWATPTWRRSRMSMTPTRSRRSHAATASTRC